MKRLKHDRYFDKPDQLFRDWDYSINSDLNKNTVIWAMFEEYVANEV